MADQTNFFNWHIGTLTGNVELSVNIGEATITGTPSVSLGTTTKTATNGVWSLGPVASLVGQKLTVFCRVAMNPGAPVMPITINYNFSIGGKVIFNEPFKDPQVTANGYYGYTAIFTILA